MRETEFERKFCLALRKLSQDVSIPVVVLKNDSRIVQGIPDRLVLYKDKFVLLEFKRHIKARQQPNQARYIEYFNRWGLATFISPENANLVMDDICSYFGLENNSKYKGRYNTID